MLIFPVLSNSPKGNHINMMRRAKCIYGIEEVKTFGTYLQFYCFAICSVLLNNSSYIVTRYHKFCIIVVLIAKLRSKRILLEVHADYLGELRETNQPAWKFVFAVEEYLVAKTVGEFVFVTEELKKTYKDRFNLQVENLRVIENGFSSQEYDNRATHIKNIKEDDCGPLKCIFIGALEEWQDLHSIIEAVKIARMNSNLILDIYGKGRTEKNIRSKIGELGLEHAVKLKGYMEKDDLVKLLPNYDVGIATLTGTRLNTTGTSAIKIYEYLCAGLQVITSRGTYVTNKLNERHKQIICCEQKSVTEMVNALNACGKLSIHHKIENSKDAKNSCLMRAYE